VVVEVGKDVNSVKVGDSVFPLAQITDAYDRLDTGRTVGKIVVAIK